MSKRDKSEGIGDDIYKALREIQQEQGVELSDRGFIADFLSRKLWLLGYRQPFESSKVT